MSFPFANTNSIELNTNFKQQFKKLLSINIANYGAIPVVLNVNGVQRMLPPGNIQLGVPNYTFQYDCMGVSFDIEIELLFNNGSSRIVIDTSTLNNC